MKEFWFVTCKSEVLGVSLESEGDAKLVSLGGAIFEDCAVGAFSADGLHYKATGQVLPVAGLFQSQEAAIKAAEIPRALEPWDNWFWDRTRPVLQSIGWHNPKLGVCLSPEVVPANGAELRFRGMLPDHPLAVRPS